MCNEERNSCGCISETLKKILLLQRQDFDNECFAGCDKPYLGPACNSICYNTRPIMLFNCCNGTAWSFPYTIDGVESTSSMFRIESIDDCCCTCRILYVNTDGVVSATNEFFTLDLNCVGALKCLEDVSIDLCKQKRTKCSFFLLYILFLILE